MKSLSTRKRTLVGSDASADLFAPPSPDGFRYRMDVITPAEEKSDLTGCRSRRLSFTATWRTDGFIGLGQKYVFGGQEPRDDASIPRYLKPLMGHCEPDQRQTRGRLRTVDGDGIRPWSRLDPPISSRVPYVKSGNTASRPWMSYDTRSPCGPFALATAREVRKRAAPWVFGLLTKTTWERPTLTSGRTPGGGGVGHRHFRLAVPSRLVPQEPAGITAPMVRPVPKRFGTARS